MKQYNMVMNKSKKEKKEKSLYKQQKNKKESKIGWSLFIRIVDLEHKNNPLLITISKSKNKNMSLKAQNLFLIYNENSSNIFQI
jgi:hypothetical protein